MKHSPIWENLSISVLSFISFVLVLELVTRIMMRAHAPVQLREGIYVNTLPLVTGVAPPSLLGSFPKGKRLPEKKRNGELRIFVFGESSVQGVPLDANASAPTMLYDMLAKAYPRRTITVVNMGRTASISANVHYYLLYAKRFRPDFILFYMGMNDGGGMSGEQCWPVSRPQLHKTWRWLMSKSCLLWSVRVFGPPFLWSLKSPEKIGKGQEWNCPLDPFPHWTDLLVKTAASTGANVMVTAPVQSAVSCIEPQNDSTSGEFEKPSLPASYKKLLVCRLTDKCDFIAMFKDYIHYAWKNVTLNVLYDPKASLDANKTVLFKHYKHNLKNKGNAWRTAARRYGADFIDFRSALEKASSHEVLADKFFADEIHLKPEGYYYLSGFWFERIKSKLDGTASQDPRIPTSKDVKAYYNAVDIKYAGTFTSMSMNYLMRGWYLTAIPGIEMISKQCPGGKCDERAAIALGWLRQKVGLNPGVPKKFTEKVKTFDPAKWQY